MAAMNHKCCWEADKKKVHAHINRVETILEIKDGVTVIANHLNWKKWLKIVFVCVCVRASVCVGQPPASSKREREMNRLSFVLFKKSICKRTPVDSRVVPRPCRTAALFNGLGANLGEHQLLFSMTRRPGLHFRCCRGTLKRVTQNLKFCVCVFAYIIAFE